MSLARGEGHGVQKLVVDRDAHTTVSYAAHVAHIGGRLVILVVLMADRERDGAAAGSDSPPAPVTRRLREHGGDRQIARGDVTSRASSDSRRPCASAVRTAAESEAMSYGP